MSSKWLRANQFLYYPIKDLPLFLLQWKIVVSALIGHHLLWGLQIQCTPSSIIAGSFSEYCFLKWSVWLWDHWKVYLCIPPVDNFQCSWKFHNILKLYWTDKSRLCFHIFLLRNLIVLMSFFFFSFKNSMFNQNLQLSKSFFCSNFQSTISFSSIFMEFSKISQLSKAFPFSNSVCLCVFQSYITV